MDSTVRVVIIAGGSGTRWGEYRDTPKHLLTIEKEVLLHRTCKQFLKYTADVCVIGLDKRYIVENTKLYLSGSNTNHKDASKFMCSQNLWNKKGRTVLVFGDVYFTNDAVEAIMTTPGAFKWFLRKEESKVSGARWKEIFAFAFDASMINSITQHLLSLISLDQVQRQAGWALYKRMTGDRFADPFANPHYVNIDDWTEDFDFPEDLQIWEEHRRAAKQLKVKNKNN